MTLSSEIIWLLLGIVFIFAEFFIPNLVISFFGGGALITAFTTWIRLTPSLTLQLLVFIMSSLFLLIFLRKYLKRIFLGKFQDIDENKEFNIEIGKIVQVVEQIIPGKEEGKVRYQGTNWKAQASEPIAPGESARIKRFENITLYVEKVKAEKS